MLFRMLSLKETSKNSKVSFSPRSRDDLPAGLAACGNAREAAGDHVSPPVTARPGAGAVLMGNMSEGNYRVMPITGNPSLR